MYGIVRTDNVKSTRVGHIYSVVVNKQLENGMVGHVGDLVSGERELRNFVTPTTASIATDSLVLIATPEVMYDQSTRAKNALGNFVIPANVPAVALEVAENDTFSVSTNMISALATDVVKGNFVVMQNGSNKLKEVASVAGTEKFVGKIELIEDQGVATYVSTSGVTGNTYKLVVIKVIKN